MFCMNCGQELPDGAKFCMKCGTPQGAVSPIGTTQAETINLDGAHTFVPAMCPNCNAHMKVDSSAKIARCDSCGTECLVQDAINAVSVNGSVNVRSASISVNGSDGITINTGSNIDSLLKRVEIMLADGDFKQARIKCDAILDAEPTNGLVYLYLLMSDLKCKRREALVDCPPFGNNPYYAKAIRYGNEDLSAELNLYLNKSVDCVEVE